MIAIRKATPDDQEAIWHIIQPILSTGDTYCFAPDSSKEVMLKFWCGDDKHTYVATVDEQVAGTFFLKDNQPGLGSHIANAGYMVSSACEGQSIGRLMCDYSIQQAKELGYRAMQFNIVVKSNERAVKLWQKLGFEIIGEIPEAFNHLQNGYTNAFIMYRKL